ncbi:MAG: isoprenylcysteine carboxylmethyltransferase family protein [Ignavibacteriae bacterium]|nr:MAG: isoprenylcysteine carboxylmethyltransferase family protein [Ignavibacteriota bacterium]
MDNIKRKAIKGITIMLIAWALIIFLTAWSLKYWQGWVYWSLWVVWSIIVIPYFMKKDPKFIERRLSGASKEEGKARKLVHRLMAVFSFIMIAFAGIDFQFHLSNIPVYLVIAADILIGIGFWIIFLTFKENSYASSSIQVEKEQELISTGPYAIVRHPMYMGSLFIYIFSPLALGSLWALIFGIGVIISMVIRLLDEEKFLIKNLQGYEDYRKKVNYRLIPYVW